MSNEIIYIPSEILPGGTERLREHSFTRWMSRDLRQAATDFCKNIGLVAIYCEYSGECLTRYLFWNPPQGAGIEIRSGRSVEEFRLLDRNNIGKERQLLSLHVSETNVYSAVWISSSHFEAAAAVLTAYGITPAQRKAAE